MRYEKLKGKYDGTSMRFSWFWILNSNFQFCKFKTRVYNHFKSKNFFHFFRQINNKQYENTIISPIKTWKRKKRRKKKKGWSLPLRLGTTQPWSLPNNHHHHGWVTQPPWLGHAQPPWLGYPANGRGWVIPSHHGW